nr:metallophosphoesterase [Roseospira visakhapatnamensis]
MLAISDIHLGHPENRAILDDVPPHPEDWLILAGDVGESLDHMARALEVFAPRFARVLWVPGNHELWTTTEGGVPLGGQAKYDALVAVARTWGVLTPEDPYPRWPGPPPGMGPADDGPVVVCPLFLLYDYSFRPPEVALAEMRDWAMEGHALCADETRLSPAPHPDRPTWCDARLRQTEARLAALPDGARTILINHFPLRRDLLFIHRVPRLAPWCGTVATEDWHRRYNAAVVVTGHQHVPRTDWRDGTRFEEVSLGYPREWRPRLGGPPRLTDVMREILPGPRPTPPPMTERTADRASLYS